VTSAYACFGIWGPRARDVLAPLTKSDLSNEAFRYMTAREISIGSVPCLAVRVTYVGELGWELYCPSEYGEALWDTIWQAGREHGICACGYRAIDALRIEKGYRVWGSDMTPEESPEEAGLAFAVKPDKGAFKGRDALIAAREQPAQKRLCCLVLEDPRSVCLGSEPVFVGDEVEGRVTTGGYGFAVERSVAYAYLPAGHAEPGTQVAVEVFGERVPAVVTAEPLWDPAGERIRA
jgi:glycine cleavage system aminomethyltransferase T